MLVGCQLSVVGSYRPPVFRNAENWSMPPQTIISLPVHTALGKSLWVGVLLITVQLSRFGLYLAPVFRLLCASPENPPHTIISLPVHTAV